MGISFISPFFLLGLAGIAIPILIHRLSQKRARVIKFPAVRLLLASQKQLAKPLRLKHLLLLALRILIVASLSFMLARPVLVSWPGFTLAGESRLTLGLIIDNSASMRYIQTLSDRATQAKEAALAILNSLEQVGRVLVIPTVAAPASAPRAQLLAPEEAIRELKALTVGFGSGDLIHAFSQAYQGLRPWKGQKEIVIVTDLTKGEWERFNLAQVTAFDSQLPVKLVRLGGEKRDDNTAVLSAQLVDAPVVGVASSVQVVLVNYGQRPVKGLAVKLLLDGRNTDQKTVDLEPFERVKTILEFRADRSGWVRAEVNITQDKLAVDDSYYLTLKLTEKLRALVVDGDPKTSLKGSETYYLVNALNPKGTAEDSVVVPRVITPDELTQLDLAPYPLMALANLEKLTTAQAERLFNQVKAGASLFIFLGDKVVAERYNAALYDGPVHILPQRLRTVYQGAQGKPERIGEIDFDHPALSIFNGASAGLTSARFYRYFLLDRSERRPGSRTLLASRRGDPLLVQGQVGRGKVFLFTSSADADWNDLSLKTGYLPLIQSLLRYGAGLQTTKQETSTWVGQPFEFSRPGVMGSRIATVTDPAGQEATVMVNSEEGKTSGRYSATFSPGLYNLSLDGVQWLKAVNVPREESDLAKVTKEELANKLAGTPVSVVNYRTAEDLAALIGTRKELWPALLIFMIILLVGEAIVANRL